nr:reverse transcriptase domain-containing protein [Tanacetum cinerariifolium]
MFGQFMKMNTTLSSGSGTLPGNTITNPKEELKGVTIQSGTVYQGPTITTTFFSLPKVIERETEVTKDTVPPTNNGSTKDVQPLVVQTETLILNSKPVVAPIIERVVALPLEIELKDLSPHLEYAFLDGDDKLPVIIAKDLSDEEKTALITVLKSHKRAIAWKLSDIKGINLEFCTHKILIEDNFEPAGGFIVVENEENELIPTRLVTGCRVCIDYRKLNEATCKDHFPLPFMDQMLERLAGNEYYCFLDGFSGYFQISIDPKDQEKTTFTCPDRTFAYRRMPFGLCNAPGAFQRYIMAIFNDMIKKTMEVFMDDFSAFRNSFQTCLSHLEKMLKRCEDTNLCLNWKKSHFMVKEGIVLSHKISKNGIEVDKVKVDVIAKLPHPTTVKGIRSFLGHAGFYRRFIQDFSKIARSMTRLLEKDTPFFFSKEEAMINSIKNGDQPLPRVTQVSIAETTSTEQPPLKDKSMWHMRGSEYGEQDRKAAVLYGYETFKATEGELLLDTYIRYLQVINDL